jgi:hypothetical protein
MKEKTKKTLSDVANIIGSIMVAAMITPAIMFLWEAGEVSAAGMVGGNTAAAAAIDPLTIIGGVIIFILIAIIGITRPR